jgi:hypothetical protein
LFLPRRALFITADQFGKESPQIILINLNSTICERGIRTRFYPRLKKVRSANVPHQ